MGSKCHIWMAFLYQWINGKIPVFHKFHITIRWTNAWDFPKNDIHWDPLVKNQFFLISSTASKRPQRISAPLQGCKPWSGQSLLATACVEPEKHWIPEKKNVKNRDMNEIWIFNLMEQWMEYHIGIGMWVADIWLLFHILFLLVELHLLN